MKRYITKEDIDSLTESQKASLRDLWLPEKYDLAIAYVCINAETDEYDEIEFVVGDVILEGNHITLVDIRHPEIGNSTDAVNSIDENVINNDLDFDEEYNTGLDFDEEFDDGDFEFTYERPTTFSKKDCLPLLSIAQMLEIFERRNYRDANFYIFATSDEKACEIGNNNISLENYGNNAESSELCDVLWEKLKSLL
ncbi:hypothetical protein [Acetivibrio clariflavus]|uniref:Uncharacterized protein n=1 Tax=Acetivibrio clariflavus (strain DSM 19732 / NBRC 101661 / EBR45) TaxID=720554 RepID=G8M2V0_ACECE|nr:hypothetical protein [Acetivibrio clariflavus]AEV68214.1 hypothetical protein Clocl_1578 [Acetivibrio clariflavus DSM 19732]